MRKLFIALLMAASLSGMAQGLTKVYDEKTEPMGQIDAAVKTARESGRHIICQVGGNWCRWCLMFADFITKDKEISQTITDNYVYIHVNYPVDGNKESAGSKQLMKRLHNAGRLGFPALVVLDANGKVLHQQDSSFLEEGEGYSRDKVLRFLNAWTHKSLSL